MCVCVSRSAADVSAILADPPQFLHLPADVLVPAAGAVCEGALCALRDALTDEYIPKVAAVYEVSHTGWLGVSS